MAGPTWRAKRKIQHGEAENTTCVHSLVCTVSCITHTVGVQFLVQSRLENMNAAKYVFRVISSWLDNMPYNQIGPNVM